MRPRLTLAWIAASLACGFAGQRFFSEFPPRLPWGAALYAAAIGLLLVALHGAEPRSPIAATIDPQPRRDAPRFRWWRTALGLAICAGCTAWALVLLLVRDRPHFWWPVLLWLAAFASYLVAVTPSLRAERRGERPAPIPRESPWWRNASRLAPLVIVIAAFALRIYSLEDIQLTLGGDEATQGLDAVQVLDGRIRSPFALGWLSVPTMVGFLFSPGVAMLGPTALGIRVTAAVGGTLAVAAVYFLVLRLQGRRMAWVTAALLATWAYHVHFSRLGAILIFDTLSMTVALLCLVRALEGGRRLDWALGGAVIGLAQYGYAGGRLAPIVVGTVCGAVLVFGGREALRRHGAGMLVLLGAALVIAAPMIQVAVRFPEGYNARLAETGVFQSGWIDRTAVELGASRTSILADQVRRAVLSWNVYRDRTAWYGSPYTILDFVPAVFFLLGLGYSTLRPLDRRRLPMLSWWWSGTLIGGALTLGPPQSQRMIGLAVPVCFFAAFTLERTAAALERAWGWPRRVTATLLVAAVALIGAFSLRTYFGEYTRSLAYGGMNGRVTTQLSRYAARELGPDWTIVLFGAPRIYSRITTLDYLAPGVQAMDVLEPLREPPPPDAFPAGRRLCFVFLPERLGELDFVRRTFPQGVTFVEPSPLESGPAIFTAYAVRRP